MHTCDSTGIHVFPRSLYAYHYYVGVFSIRSFVNIEVGEGEKGWFCLIIVLTKVGEGRKGWLFSIIVRSFSLWLHTCQLLRVTVITVTTRNVSVEGTLTVLIQAPLSQTNLSQFSAQSPLSCLSLITGIVETSLQNDLNICSAKTEQHTYLAVSFG